MKNAKTKKERIENAALKMLCAVNSNPTRMAFYPKEAVKLAKELIEEVDKITE
jgi:hypothetical protein